MEYITESHRNLVHRSLKNTRSTGYREGVYHLSIAPDAAFEAKLGTREMSLIRQLDRLLLRVVCQNYDAVLSMARTNDPEKLLEMAWSVLAPARFAGAMEGDYEVRFPNDRVVQYSLSQWDESILKQYTQLLKSIYEKNKPTLDQVLQSSSDDKDSPKPPSPTLEAA